MTAYYRVNFELANNEDLRQTFALSDTGGTPLNLTGASFKMQIKSFAGAPVAEASSVNGRIAVLDAAAGQFEVNIPAAVMRTIAEGSYQHDLVLSGSDGSTKRIWDGVVSLSQVVTA